MTIAFSWSSDQARRKYPDSQSLISVLPVLSLDVSILTYSICVARRGEKNMAVEHQETYVHIQLRGSRCVLVEIVLSGDTLRCSFIAHIDRFYLSQDEFLGWSRSIP